MKEQKLCPCCGRHCDLNAPACERGAAYQRRETVMNERPKQNRETDIPQQLIISLRNINHVMRALYEGKGSQKRILIVLNETGSITQRELTERLGIQPGSASEVIAKLEDAGNIVRIPSRADRRTMDIALTEQGRALAEEAAAQREKRHEEMFSCLSEDEKVSLLTLLEKINEDWEMRYQKMEKAHEHIAGHPHGHARHGRKEWKRD